MKKLHWLVIVIVTSLLTLPGCSQSGGTPEPVDCTYVSVPAVDPEPTGLAGITSRHNYWRARVGSPPVQWNETLADMAQDYADQLIFSHDADRTSGSGFSSVGENLYFTSLTVFPPSDAVDLWAAERLEYEYGTDVNGTNYMDFGHYTQVVWSGTTDIGCGIASGEVLIGSSSMHGTIVVCRYGTAGNIMGQAPYGYIEAPCVDLDNDDVLQKDDADDTDRSVQ